jgi:hypothetical protein
VPFASFLYSLYVCLTEGTEKPHKGKHQENKSQLYTYIISVLGLNIFSVSFLLRTVCKPSFKKIKKASYDIQIKVE